MARGVNGKESGKGDTNVRGKGITGVTLLLHAIFGWNQQGPLGMIIDTASAHWLVRENGIAWIDNEPQKRRLAILYAWRGR